MYSEGKDSYKKTGEDGGKRGTDFQVDVSTMVYLNAIKNGSSWGLSCENKEAGKFDDLVLEYLQPSTAFFIQAKYKKKPNAITYDRLLTDKPDDFGLAMYFICYQKMAETFKGQNTLIICSNSDIGKCVSKFVNKKKLSKESPLYLDGRDVYYYTFKEPFLDEFKENLETYVVKNVKEKFVVSDESVNDFFSRLQLVVNYPTGNEIRLEFKNVISTIELAKDLELCADYIRQKIDAWFLKEKKAPYLTEAHGTAVSCEIRSITFCNDLRSYDIAFKNTKLPLKRPNTRVLHIISEQDPILNLIKTFQGLQREDIKKILFVDKDKKLEIQMQFIEAFSVKFYTDLVIECVRARTDDVVQKMYKNLKKILSKAEYKTVILIAEEDDRLVEKFKHSNFAFEAVEKEKLSFCDLSEDSQKRFREMRLIDFQGTEMNLNELLPTLTSEELNKIVKEEILRKFIRKEKITVGKKIDSLGDTVKYYISRRFNRNGENIAEEQMYQYVETNEEKVIVISDSPGMGKSTVLTSLASAIKETNPSLWVLRINVINYRNILWKLTQKKVKSISPWVLLNSLETSSITTHFEKDIFYVPKKVVLMIDGADEACPECEDIILSLIADSTKESNIANIFITTRPHLRGKIESDLGVTSWTLEPLSEENQIIFLKKYLVQKLGVDKVKKQKCKVYVKTLVTEISPSIMASVEGIPLQISLLAEAVMSKDIDDNVEEWQTCEEFLDSNSEKPKLLELKVAQLLDMSISRGNDKFVERYKPRDSQKILKDCKLYHFTLALKITFSIPDNQPLDNYQKNRKNIDEKNPLKLGIIQKVDGQICFTHSVFIDYFLATYVIEKLEHNAGNDYFLDFIISMLKYKYCEVCILFGMFFLKEIDYLPGNIYKSIGEKGDCNNAHHILFELVELVGWLYTLLF